MIYLYLFGTCFHFIYVFMIIGNKLFASNHYFSANRLFDYKIYKHSDELSKSIINLFNDKYYTEDKAVKTIEIINRFISI